MTVAKRYVPNTAPKKKNGYRLDTKSPAANQQSRDTKAPVQKGLSKFVSEKQRTQEKAVRRKALKRMQ